MKVLLSIKPIYAERILNGTKLYEYRKTPFKNKEFWKIGNGTVLLYATKPVGSIIGEFKIGHTLSGGYTNVWYKTAEHSGITIKEYAEYYRSSLSVYAHFILSSVRYDKPLTLEDVGVKRAPQSFMYIEEK